MKKYTIISKSLFVITLLMTYASFQLFSQPRVDIWSLMERRDLRLSEIDALAKRHFDLVGRERGSGHKQYERWKFEKQFHLDENGYILPDDFDSKAYLAAQGNMEATGTPGGAFTELGPSLWNRTSSWNPGVGRLTSIAVFPSDRNIIYVTSPGGGIWKTTTGGEVWTPLADQNNSLMNLFSVAVDPSNPDIVYTGNTSGIYKSTDGGTTWVSKISGMGTVRKILLHPGNSNILFAVGSGIFKSTDGGNTWTQSSAISIEDIEFKPGNTSIMYASGTTVLRSADEGNTWTTLGVTDGITNSGRTLISVSPANPEVVYAVQASGSIFGRMYRSDNSGLSFITTVVGSSSSGTNYFGYETTGTGTSGQAWYDMAMTVNPLNANEVHIAGIICWKSTNGGVSFVAETAWSFPNSIGYNHADVHALEWVGNNIYSGSDGGIFRSTDNGDNWTDLSNGLGIRQFYRIANSNTDQVRVTGGAQDNGSSILKSTGWIDWLGADGMDCVVSPLNADIIIGTSQYGSLYKTTNGGAGYSLITEPATGNWVTPLAIESNSNTLYAGWDGVYKSTDLGASWTKLSGTVITSKLNTLAVAPSDPGYIYASVASTLYVTKDGGSTWSTYAISGTISQVAIHPTNPEKIWVATTSSTYRMMASTDAGATFTNISGNLPAVAGRSIVVDNTADEGLYAGMNIGVYYTNNKMTGWINLTDNLPQVAVNEVELQLSAGKLRVATYGRGLWERDIYNPCSAPASLNTTNVSYNSATLNWTAVSGATGYNVDYKATAASVWTTAVSNTQQTSFNLSGIAQGTGYDWRVSTICSGGTSSYSLSSFTTGTVCPTPANLLASGITTNSVNLSWSSASGSTSYTLEYKAVQDPSWITIGGITATQQMITGLSEGTTYDWRVRATCSGGTGNAATSVFTTAITCNAPSNLNTTNIASTSATLNWTAVPGATGYNVEYKLTSASTWTVRATNITATTYNLTGLTGGTSYDWRVRSNCGTLSGYSQTSFTTTTPPCTDNYETNNTSKTAKSISLNTPVNALIATGTDQDWFKFSTPNTSATNVRVALSNLPADYNVYLYNKNVALLGSSSNTGTSNESIIYNTTVKRATYYVLVKGVNSSEYNASNCYNLLAESSSNPYSISPASGNLLSTAPDLENTGSGTWNLYPVPVRDLLNIRYISPENTDARLQVHDITGRLLITERVEIQTGVNNFKLDLKGYRNGIYLVKFVMKNNVLTEKIRIGN